MKSQASRHRKFPFAAVFGVLALAALCLPIWTKTSTVRAQSVGEIRLSDGSTQWGITGGHDIKKSRRTWFWDSDARRRLTGTTSDR
jgi:hypothetical protein